MATALMSAPQQAHTLAEVRRGMFVYDFDQQPVGVVESVVRAGEYQQTFSDDTAPKAQSPIPTISGTFVGEDLLPELLYVKLTRTGFAKVKPINPNAPTYYITPPQIDIVGNKAIILRVGKNVLLKS